MDVRVETLRRLSALAILCAAASCAAPEETRAGRRPNVVLIFMDDLGYADIGPFGAKAHRTPHLDRLAREGRIFTDFYVSQAVCSASRASLLTGCYNVRVGIFGALGPRSKVGLADGEVTLAELFRSQGYATACFGKWHLGDAPEFLPTRHGFDEYFGLPYSNDMWPFHPTARHFPDLPLLEGTHPVRPQVTPRDQEMLTTWYTERAVAFIEKNRSRPFFLYVPHSMVHVPLHVSDRFRGRSGAGLFGDVLMEVDDSVGRIVEAIRRNGLERNTLVLFTSDNGPWLPYGDHAGSAGPFREGKGTTFEGGVRVPLIAWGPGTIPAGTVCREPAMTIDVLPTMARLIGAALPEHPIDGRDIGPLLRGEPGARSPHEALYFYWHRELQAVRWGRWKLHFLHTYPTLAGRPGGKGGLPARTETGRIELSLFDLERDPGETRDVQAEHPEVVARIQTLAEAMRGDLGDSALKRPATGAREPGRLR
ncbi:MAG TPA: sulfatase [Planctomycetota bacterium]|nr:sulfatase [Planctomycetota bacterium]